MATGDRRSSLAGAGGHCGKLSDRRGLATGFGHNAALRRHNSHFSVLIWVVAHAVYAPGRITIHRLQGALVVYLSFATVFASAYALIWELSLSAFANLLAPSGGSMLYFSLTTLTTTGYGDIVAIDPFARNLANFESVLGQFYLAITVARLVTLELDDRRRRPPL